MIRTETILIIDDDPQLAKLIRMRLEAAGYRTLTALIANQALAYLGLDRHSGQDPEVDLVMLDIFLPDVSGIEVCLRIRADSRTCDIPVIMLTGSTDEEHLQLAFDAGAVDYIEKPFKNDRFGHQAGDECLRQVAVTFNRVAHRSNDLIARYGGEEFAVVLPDASQPDTLIMAENLRQMVEALRLPHPDSPFEVVTISEGVAIRHPKPKELASQLIEAADTALYHSKHSGRNRVSIGT